MTRDLTILLLLLPLVAGLIARRTITRTFTDHQAMPLISRADGWTVANRLLDTHGMHTVTVERAAGSLSDHFDSDAATVRLSADVADSATVAAAAVAAHEVAHADQDTNGHRLYRARMRIGRPVMQLSQWSSVILIGGFLLGIPPLIGAAAVLLAGLAVFAVITLPVELHASRQAVAWLADSHLVSDTELPGIRRVLRAAAFTYLTAMAYRIGLLLFVVGGVLLAGG